MRSLLRARMLALALVAGSVAVACGGASGPPQTTAPTSPPAAATGSTGEAPTETPDILRFKAPRLSGGVLHGEDYAGTDVALWFWAPW